MTLFLVYDYKSDSSVFRNHSCGLSGLVLYNLIAYLAPSEHMISPLKGDTLCTVLFKRLATS